MCNRQQMGRVARRAFTKCVKLLRSTVPGHVALATSYRGLLTEEILQVNMFSTTEQGPMRTPVPLNFNVDPKTGVASSIGGVSTESILQVGSPRCNPTLRLGARGCMIRRCHFCHHLALSLLPTSALALAKFVPSTVCLCIFVMRNQSCRMSHRRSILCCI